MSRKPSTSQNLALRVAAAARAQEEEEQAPDELPVPPPPIISAADEHKTSAITPSNPAPVVEKPRGRPKGRRHVEARQTVYLDKDRHTALARLAEDRGRSIHSLIIEGIDLVTGKPTKAAWD